MNCKKSNKQKKEKYKRFEDYLKLESNLTLKIRNKFVEANLLVGEPDDYFASVNVGVFYTTPKGVKGLLKTIRNYGQAYKICCRLYNTTPTLGKLRKMGFKPEKDL